MRFLDVTLFPYLSKHPNAVKEGFKVSLNSEQNFLDYEKLRQLYLPIAKLLENTNAV
jgi:hypothetical protein